MPLRLFSDESTAQTGTGMSDQSLGTYDTQIVGKRLIGLNNFGNDAGVNEHTRRVSNNVNHNNFEVNYAVSVHYKITYEVLISLGYSQQRSDLIAHYTSLYADHPEEKIKTLDANLHYPISAGAPLGIISDRYNSAADKLKAEKVKSVYPNDYVPDNYRDSINYSPTKGSQLEINSKWHSMMSNAEAEAGMSRIQAKSRGLSFGWDNVFAQEYGEDLGKLGQGLHALQDAIAHQGVKTHDHLGKNLMSLRMMMNDMYGNTEEARLITRSAIIVIRLLKKEDIDLTGPVRFSFLGMSKDQRRKVEGLFWVLGIDTKNVK